MGCIVYSSHQSNQVHMYHIQYLPSYVHIDTVLLYYVLYIHHDHCILLECSLGIVDILLQSNLESTHYNCRRSSLHYMYKDYFELIECSFHDLSMESEIHQDRLCSHQSNNLVNMTSM